MKTIGLIGGMSWESTALYYKLINQGVATQLGGLHSAKILLYSVDFAEIEALQREGNWDVAGQLLAQAAQKLATGGADFIVLCTNTMHKVGNWIETASSLPLLHIADATAERLLADGICRVGLLGTRYTMEQDFYRGRLADRYGLEVLVPAQPDRDIIHRVIYDELCHGIIRPESKAEYCRIIQTLIDQGAQGIIFGCTEIGMLVTASDVATSVYDTTQIHAEQAVYLALEE
ncbi:MAG: aspartate/glutamate racemase family protein [Acidobacteria bacterium]|nr:aspartate/glutamate racemase family protein [Acidobacteriota bacterium]